MVKIKSVEWGKIKVNGRDYGQVLIIGDRVMERDEERLHQLFDTTHEIGDWEVEQLFSGEPEVILLGSGFNGVLRVSEDLRTESEKLGIELKILKTPGAVEEFNRLVKEGKRVNALIHTTC